MLLRLVRFTFSEEFRSRAQAMADDLIPAIKQQPGCVSAVFFGATDGENGLCVVWDSQQHADQAAAIISPRLEAHLAGNVIVPSERQLYPVLAS